MKFAYLNKTICFTSSEANIFNILGYFDKIIKELDKNNIHKKRKIFLDFTKTLRSKSYDEILKIHEESFSCKIKII